MKNFQLKSDFVYSNVILQTREKDIYKMAEVIKLLTTIPTLCGGTASIFTRGVGGRNVCGLIFELCVHTSFSNKHYDGVVYFLECLHLRKFTVSIRKPYINISNRTFHQVSRLNL